MSQDLVEEFLAGASASPELVAAFRRHCHGRGFAGTRTVRNAWDEFCAGWNAALRLARRRALGQR